ncbi:DUF3426 domain-containing protein [Pseudomonas panipatensis]|uniref:DUF3426 domain-containing protein n=1 Tax=Pseudomonas panipatensis TaxID=428992 RepID=UPI0035AD817A
MSESFITQCPHCQTSFRVNQAQLGAANGAVRCGACLKVFNAPQHMQGTRSASPSSPSEPVRPPVSGPASLPSSSTAAAAPAQAARPEQPAPAATQPPARPSGATLGWPLAPHAARHATDAPAPAPAPAKPVEAPASASAKGADETLWIHDDLDLDSLNLDEELAKLDELELSQEFRELKGAPTPSEALLGERAESRDPHDERWAEALLRDEQQAAPGGRQEPRLGRIEEAAEERPEPRLEPSASAEPVLAAKAAEPEADDEEALPALSARRDDDDEVLDADEEPEQSQEPPLESSAETAEAEHETRAEPALRVDSLRELNDEPLQLDWQKPKGRWGRRILWLLLILLAFAGLAAQYIAYHFDELAREDTYRPWFAQLCPELGCSLPSKVDVDQIRSSNLVVRSHPDFNGALVVDAIIYNRASFSQPFPLLELRFADLNGQLIASRSFKPSEYLGGELAGQTEMPPQTPIHISLDILDPGPKAVNYSLSFHSPE